MPKKCQVLVELLVPIGYQIDYYVDRDDISNIVGSGQRRTKGTIADASQDSCLSIVSFFHLKVLFLDAV